MVFPAIGPADRLNFIIWHHLSLCYLALNNWWWRRNEARLALSMQTRGYELLNKLRLLTNLPLSWHSWGVKVQTSKRISISRLNLQSRHASSIFFHFYFEMILYIYFLKGLKFYKVQSIHNMPKLDFINLYLKKIL